MLFNMKILTPCKSLNNRRCHEVQDTKSYARFLFEAPRGIITLTYNITNNSLMCYPTIEKGLLQRN